MTTATGQWKVGDLRLSSGRRRSDRRMRGIFTAAALTTLVITLLIIFILVRDAWTFFVDVPKGDLWNIGWFPRRGIFDVKTLVVGSFMVTGIAMLTGLIPGLTLGIIGIAGIVVALVYLFDVRVRIAEITG